MNFSHDNQLPENLPVLPPEAPKRRKEWFWVLVAVVIFGGGLVILIFVGDVFIREVTQEVVIEERGGQVPFSGQKKVPDPFLAPYFELENLKGEKVKVSDFLGASTVVTFWTTWNTLSVDQVRILAELRGQVPFSNEKKVPDPLFQIVAINSQEDRSIVSNFIERGDYEVEVLLDENGAVGEMYGIQTLPVTYFLDKDGNIAEVYVGLLDTEAIVDKVGLIISGE